MNYEFDLDTISRDIRLRNGDVRQVQLRELSEEQNRFRQNLVVDTQATRGRGRGGGTSIRLDRQRKFDFKACIVGWDLMYSDLKKDVPEGEDHVLPLEDKVFTKLPGYISNQIADAIQEINAEPEEDMPQSQDDDALPEGHPVENPT